MKLLQIAIGVVLGIPIIIAIQDFRNHDVNYSDYPLPSDYSPTGSLHDLNGSYGGPSYDLGGGYKGNTYEHDPKGTYYDDVLTPAPKLHNQYHSSITDDRSYGKDDYSYDGSKE